MLITRNGIYVAQTSRWWRNGHNCSNNSTNFYTIDIISAAVANSIGG
uniref:Bm13026 n=1 Tax=Brugia malayi TaxID=6279 RepID=A0A1I9G8W4_BRUMA|nr:Bm13026 [Brugia malayi]